MKRALVAGGGLAGIRAALDLADSGVEVTFVEESPALAQDSCGTREGLLATPDLLRAWNHKNITIMTGASLAEVCREDGAFRTVIKQRPQYVSAERCTACGQCEAACPVEIRQPGGASHKAIHAPGVKSVSSAFTVDRAGIAPCTAACPAGVNPHGYIALISRGKFSEALDLITQAVAFPRVLGRVCNHPCEKKCTRGEVDRPVAICSLKRFAAETGSVESSLIKAQNGKRSRKPEGHPRVAIIGAGPAGLTAARDLARLGHRSTVFESLPVPGGMITVGMPRFRLPREVRQADIADIVKLGIEIKTNMPIGPGLTLDDLRGQGFEAILIATGAHKNQKLGVAGETLEGVMDSIAFLQALNLKQPITIGSRVVVIGGGYTAIDSARTAIRLHCERVLILYRRSFDEMPANAEEVAEARDEGVEFEYLVAPVRIIGRDGKVTGVECIRMGLGEPDASGRRRPIPITGSEFCVEADTVIVAVGQRPDLSFLAGDTTLTDGRRYIAIDRTSMTTKVQGIFAAGDVAGEAGTLVEAIAAGRRAARSIDRYLRGEKLREGPQLKRAGVEVDLSQTYIPPIPRQPMPCLPNQERVGNFEEVDLGFNKQAAMKEARRCLNCAGCSGCLECEYACQTGALDYRATARKIEIAVAAIVAPERDSLLRNISADKGLYWLKPGDTSAAAALALKVAVDLKSPGPTARKKVSTPDNVFMTLAGRPEPRLGVFVCRCGGAISGIIDIPGLLLRVGKMAGVVCAVELNSVCNGDSVEIKAAAKRYALDAAVVAGCACCNLSQVCFSCTDRRLKCKSDLAGSPVYFDFVNIREQCAWAHASQPGEASAKALAIISGALARLQSGTDAPPEPAGTVSVDPARCRSCGRCVAACPFEAITLNLNGRVSAARVEPSLCRACGRCLACCPSGALSQAGNSNRELSVSLDAFLAGKAGR